MSSRDDALVAETLAAAPRVEASMPAPTLEVPPTGMKPVAEPVSCFGDDVSARHGRVTSRVLGLAIRNISGKQLDDDLETTAGEVLGEAFGLLGRFGNRLTYISVFMGLVAVPLGVTGYWLWRSSAAKDVTPK